MKIVTSLIETGSRGFKHLWALRLSRSRCRYLGFDRSVLLIKVTFKTLWWIPWSVPVRSVSTGLQSWTLLVNIKLLCKPFISANNFFCSLFSLPPRLVSICSSPRGRKLLISVLLISWPAPAARGDTLCFNLFLIVTEFSRLRSQCVHVSRSRRRWGSASSPGRSAARCVWSARRADTLAPTSCGWRTVGRWRTRRERKGRRRGGLWAWRTWRRSTAGSTPATSPTEPERSTPPTRWKSYVSRRTLQR